MFNDNEIISIINQVSNLQLALLGIAITVFTVVYSFIINKREELKNLSALIKNGKGNPLIIQKSTFLVNHIKSFRIVNNNLIKIIIVSFILFIFSWLSSNFKLFIEMNVLYGILFIVGLEFIFITVILFKIITKYKKETKI